MAMACLVGTSVAADETGTVSPPVQEGTLEAIVVTAQKRAESVQNVPIAITALSGATLNERHVDDIMDIPEIAPDVGISEDNSNTRLAIRGITFNSTVASDAEARVAYYVDGILIGRPGNISETFFDIDRIEVLRGPQGTLSGRNAVAGSVNLITQDPSDDFRGYLQTDLGNYSSVETEGAVGGPLTDTLSGRVAFRQVDHDGYGENLLYKVGIDNQNSRDARTKLKFTPDSALNVVLSLDYSQANDRACTCLGGYVYPTVPTPPELYGALANAPGNPRDNYFYTPPDNFRVFYGSSVTVNWDIGNGYKLVSLSAYRHTDESYQQDLSFSSIPLGSPALFGEVAAQESEELRIQKDFDRGNWMIGTYLFRELYQDAGQVALNTLAFGGPNFLAAGEYDGGREETRSASVFAQGTYDLTNALSLTLGGRFTSDHKRKTDEYEVDDFTTPYDSATACREPCGGPPPGTPFDNDNHSWNNFSPLGTLQYKFDSTKMAYVTVSKGFKSGGYNLGYGGFYNPETITDYETGFKVDLFESTLRVNAAGFYYDYKNLQVVAVGADVGSAPILNAAAAKLYGTELEIAAAPTRELRFNLAASWMHSEFTEFSTFDPARPQLGLLDLAGNRLPNAPKYTATYGAEYAIDSAAGTVTPRIEGSTLSQVYLDQYNVPGASVGGYTLFNALVNFKTTSDRYFLSAYVRNIANLTRISGAIVSGSYFGSALQADFIPPRTYGVKFGVNFK
jgi:iron complex outermembrane recepter protein